MATVKSNRVLAIKNVTNENIPKHVKQCSVDELRERATKEGHRSLFCADCEAPMWDGTEYRFKPGEEVLLSEECAIHLQRQFAKKLVVQGKPQDLMSVLINPEGIFTKDKDGKMVARRVEIRGANTGTMLSESADEAIASGRRIANVVV